jgi:hypothetical protein
MSKWSMRGQFRHLQFKTFLMTLRTPQCEVFWAFNLSSEFSRVLEDSKFPLLGVWASPSHLAQSGVATHNDQRFAQDVMCPESRGSPNYEDFGMRISGLPLGSPGTKSHLDVAPMESCRVYYKGEGGGFPQVQAMVSLVCSSCPWFILAPKVFQLCTNHFVLVLCRSVWVSEAFHFFLVPSQNSSTPLYPSIVLRAKERAPTPCPSVVFNLGFTFEPLKELGVRQ